MEHLLLGRSGLRVSRLCLGTMTFGGGSGVIAGGGTDDSVSKAIFDRFAEAGGTFLDTACSYSDGRSEEVLGDLIAADRDHFVVASKYGNGRYSGLMRTGNSRRNMMRSVEESLRRLKTDRIDLFYLHVWDKTTPIDEVMRGFDDLVRSGKVVYAGLSDTPAWEISRANMMADLLGRTPVSAIQLEYSLARRTPENDLLPMAQSLGIGVTCWAPLAAGILARPVEAAGQSRRRPGQELSAHDRPVVEAIAQVAGKTGYGHAEVALAWLLQDERFGPVIPIVGATKLEHIEAAVRALEVRLDPADLAVLDRSGAPDLAFPHNLLRSDFGREVTAGGEYSRLRTRSA